MIRHGTALSVRGRGRAAYESYHQLDPDEVQRRRAYISCRQGGRAEFRRQLLDQQFGAAARGPSRVSAGRGRGVGWQPPVPGTSAMPCPPAMEDYDNYVSTTWVAANLPELTDPTALEISALCMAVPTAEASVQTERTLSVRSVGVDARPIAGRGCDASAQTYTELLSVGTDARALPVLWLSPPDVPTEDLATAMVDIIAATRPQSLTISAMPCLMRWMKVFAVALTTGL